MIKEYNYIIDGNKNVKYKLVKELVKKHNI